jgi:RNA polymerase sigma-70 factor (ECF subfamily)
MARRNGGNSRRAGTRTATRATLRPAPAPEPPVRPPASEPAPAESAAAHAEDAAAGVDLDAQRMLDFQKGDLGAFEQLVRNNQAKVFSVVVRFVQNEAEAEDLVQEVFVRVFRTAARYEPRARFSTWLYRIAVNVSLNALRARAKLQTVSLDVLSETTGEEFHRGLADPDVDLPHETLKSGELAARVTEAIEMLPEKQRIAVVLSRYEKLCYEEIGHVLDCSVMAVKSLLSRARCNLKSRLARYLRYTE